MTPVDTLETTAPKSKLHLLDLPGEVHRDILSHCSQSDLICLALVCRHLKDLACAQLYRNFHIVFPDEDDPTFDSPIDGLAGGLDTFVTSEYDYAKHLRDLSLDTLSAGSKAEAAYKPYLYTYSCGKFLNTLLLLTLRKANSLESFRWNIRVELSRPVYQALHNIKTLRQLHIRLQAGPSLYEAPPPLPFSPSVASSASSSSTHLHEAAPPLPPPSLFTIPGPASLFYTPPNALAPPPPPKPAPRARPHKKPTSSKEPPTLSAFAGLKTLSILDIDSLDLVPELAACVRNSSSTLTKLKLSFSDSLGLQARRPQPDFDPDDSDAEEDFPIVAAPTAGPDSADDVGGPTKVFRAQEEKKSQEGVLGRIFDVEPAAAKKAPTRKTTRDAPKESKEEDETTDPGKHFINAIKGVSNKLFRELSGADDLTLAQQEIIDVIEAAARKYVASEEAKVPASGDEKDQKTEKPGEASSASSSSSAQGQQKKGTDGEKEGEQKENHEGPEGRIKPTTNSLFENTKAPKPKDGPSDDVSPEDINIEEPEEQLSLDAHDTASKTPHDEPVTPPTETSSSPPPAQETKSRSPVAAFPSINGNTSITTEQKAHFLVLMEKLALHEAQVAELQSKTQQLCNSNAPFDPSQIAESEKQVQECRRHIHDIQQQITAIGPSPTNTHQGGTPAALDSDLIERHDRQVSEYLRSTRGMPLQTLAIYLIPVKASILSKAVDLRVLRHITLLNVGSQAPIWAHMHRENKESPLALRKIFTDNVSMPFLNLVSHLDELHELFMLERENGHKPESFAPKTTVTISQIRRMILKKHLPKLKRLMMKNMAQNNWDLDEKTTLLLCRRGRHLRELACNMDIKAVHTLMQNMSGLVNLRALHIIQLRNDDTCVWVMRETKKFLIDNLTHHPEMKLEWLSIDDDRVERIVRHYGPSDADKKRRRQRQSKKTKGKQKASAAAAAAAAGGNASPGFLGNAMFPLLPALDSWGPGGDSDEDDDEDDDDDDQAMRLETIENIHFYDVWGVKIFKKEVLTGRL